VSVSPEAVQHEEPVVRDPEAGRHDSRACRIARRAAARRALFRKEGLNLNAIIATPYDLDVDDAEERLREWGWQCGAYLSDEESRRPYRDTKIREIVEIGKQWHRDRDARREAKERRKAAAAKAAATRARIRENKFTICDRCNLLFYAATCPRCAGDPLYTGLGKQTRSFAPRDSDGVVLRITGSAAAVDEIVAGLPPDLRDVLKKCYCDGKTPWRKHAWTLRISWREFDQLREAAIEAVAERLAKRSNPVL
jgi:hypothetical protein